jgi:hypothetical protein
MGGSAPKPPPPTPQEKALEARTERRLDEEIERTERRLKAQARGKVGAQSLLRGFQGRDRVRITPAPKPKPVQNNNRGRDSLSPFARRMLGGIERMKK